MPSLIFLKLNFNYALCQAHFPSKNIKMHVKCYFSFFFETAISPLRGAQDIPPSLAATDGEAEILHPAGRCWHTAGHRGPSNMLH